MSIQTFGKGALRVAKNYTKGYSDVQAKVREATSNDPWGPSGTQMNEIAQMTFNQCVSLPPQPQDLPSTKHGDVETTLLKLWRCWTNVSMTRAKIGATSLKFVSVLVL
jgi:hypothetical protein